MPAWLEWITWIAGGLTALWIIYRRVMVPMWKFVVAANRIVEAIPTMVGIAEEFKPNGGESLRDRVDDTNRIVTETQTALEARVIDHTHYHDDWEERIIKLEAERIARLEKSLIDLSTTVSELTENPSTS